MSNIEEGVTMPHVEPVSNPEIFNSANELNQYLEKLIKQGNIQFHTVEEALQGYVECVDGRQDIRCVVGTPGGDEAEFILALRAAETTLGQELTPEQIEELVTKYIESRNRFYMHTDSHAAHDLLHDVAHDEEFPQLQQVAASLAESHDISEQAYVEFIQSVPESIREAFLSKYLVNPKYIGCGHLKLMLGDVEKYQTRTELVHAALKAFYKKFWEGSHTILTVLKHDHKEKAVVVAQVDGELTQQTIVPFIKPNADSQVFVYTPQLVQLAGEQMVKFVSDATGADVVETTQKMHALRDVQTGNTVGTLATSKGKNTYTATFHENELVSVQ